MRRRELVALYWCRATMTRWCPPRLCTHSDVIRSNSCFFSEQSLQSTPVPHTHTHTHTHTFPERRRPQQPVAKKTHSPSAEPITSARIAPCKEGAHLLLRYGRFEFQTRQSQLTACGRRADSRRRCASFITLTTERITLRNEQPHQQQGGTAVLNTNAA